jgi:hypothetical protein
MFKDMKICSNFKTLISNFESKTTKNINNDNLFVYIKEDMMINCGILKIAKTLYNR